MEEVFIYYLRNNSKKKYEESVVRNYVYWVKRVMKRENNLTWDGLSSKIDILCVKYDYGGQEEDFGEQGNRSVINALKRFKEFSKQYEVYFQRYISEIESYISELKKLNYSS